MKKHVRIDETMCQIFAGTNQLKCINFYYDQGCFLLLVPMI